MLRIQVGGYGGYRWWPGQEMTGAGTSVGRRKWGAVGTSLSVECSPFWFSNCVPLSPGVLQGWSLSLAPEGRCY